MTAKSDRLPRPSPHTTRSQRRPGRRQAPGHPDNCRICPHPPQPLSFPRFPRRLMCRGFPGVGSPDSGHATGWNLAASNPVFDRGEHAQRRGTAPPASPRPIPARQARGPAPGALAAAAQGPARPPRSFLPGKRNPTAQPGASQVLDGWMGLTAGRVSACRSLTGPLGWRARRGAAGRTRLGAGLARRAESDFVARCQGADFVEDGWPEAGEGRGPCRGR